MHSRRTAAKAGPSRLSIASDATMKSEFSLTDEERYLTRREVAAYLRCSIPTLERWAGTGEGPPFTIVAKKALYPLNDVRRFVRAKRGRAA
jgi:hypothetical protein